MKPYLAALLFGGIIWASPTPVLAQQTRVELTDPSKPTELQVEIEWGSIRVMAEANADGLTIESQPDRLDEVSGGLYTVSEEGNLVTVRQAPLTSGTFRSAHLEIKTPLDTNVTLKVNRGGDIWVTGTRGLVEVTNLNGSVELARLSGAAAVNASNGSIIAGFVDVDPERDMIFASLNGSVELCLPSTFSAEVHLTTAGDPIRSDFQVERQRPVRTVSPGETLTGAHSDVTGRIGSGESRLRVSTLNGEIYLGLCD